MLLSIAYLAPGTGSSAFTDVFRDALRTLGYIEDRNITIEYRFAAGREERYPDILADLLVSAKVDAIVTTTPLGAIAAKNATQTVPVVFPNVGNPVETGLVASLSRPGRNLTGLAFIASADTIGKRLELLKELLPGLSRLAIIWSADDPIRKGADEVIQRASNALRFKIQPVELSGANDTEIVLDRIKAAGAQAISIQPSGLTWAYRERLVKMVNHHRLPAVYGMRDFVEVGGLMAYGLDRPEPYRRAAAFVDKILKGANPAEMPIEQPSKFELVINAKTAKALNLTIPPSLLLRADQVIE